MYNNRSRQSQLAERAKARKELHAKLEAEAQQKKVEKTEANFPSLGGGGAPSTMKFGTSFSSLAAQWKEEEERQKIIGARKVKEDDIQGVFMRYGRRTRIRRVEEDDGEYYDEDGYEGSSDGHGFVLPPKVDADGWEEVRHKRIKPKRELTSRELEEKYALDDDDDENDMEDVDHNGELFETNRHDHH
jgi:hypothetical protein